MGKFLNTWTDTSKSDLEFILSRDSLFNENVPIFCENRQQTYLVKVLRSLHSHTVGEIVKTRVFVNYYEALDVDSIKFVELWYFYFISKLIRKLLEKTVLISNPIFIEFLI